MVILYSSARKASRTARFGVGIIPQRPVRVPVGPSDADRSWWAGNNVGPGHASDDQWADEFDRRTMSPRDHDEAVMAEADARLARIMGVSDAELAENGVVS